MTGPSNIQHSRAGAGRGHLSGPLWLWHATARKQGEKTGESMLWAPGLGPLGIIWGQENGNRLERMDKHLGKAFGDGV